MLRIITGLAGTGKTSQILSEIASAVAEGRGGNMLLVPEQYSHEAERELCARCGDGMSLYAEVFSFTGLARRVTSRVGGAAGERLDKGGRQLCMALALSRVASRLKVYGGAARRAELQSALLSAVDELKSAGVGTEALSAAAARSEGALSQKLWDMALILESYDAVVAAGRADPADMLDVLARQIPQSGIGPETRVYIDGFIDFTHQEREVMRAMLASGAELTVCFTLDSLEHGDEVFALPRIAARKLIECARELGCETRTLRLEGSGRGGAVAFFNDNMFSCSSQSWGGRTDAISLFCAEDMTRECELAAARALELVREKGCRWRDIAVAVRGFDDYDRALRSVFEHYGVPLFVSEKSELLSKPLPMLISCAYEIVLGGWDVDDVVSYMRTSLSGLDTEECDELADYVFKWQLRAPAWERDGDWRQHPDGYGGKADEAAAERLARINALRRRLADPLRRFARRALSAHDAASQASALAGLLTELRLPERLSERAEELSAAGRGETAAEYLQLWDIIVSALEQSADILGDTPMEAEEFGRLFGVMLSKYDVGTIPVALDRVSAGDFDRMRRRNIRHLIVLGASDSRLPAAEEGGGVFSTEERERLLELDIDLGGAGESELWREFSLIYNCLSLPSETLMMCFPASDADGAAQRPAFVMNRAAALFGIRIESADMTLIRASCEASALSLAAAASCGGARERAAERYFREKRPERLAALERAAGMSRGRLSARAVEALYGSSLRLSASRIDRFASCKFSYFCQYGLKAKKYEPAEFRPPELGTFIHAVLERSAREVKARGGWKSVDDGELRAIVDAAVDAYAEEELGGLAEKSERFRHLFGRLRADVRQIVSDMADELRRSDFEPLDFELDFSAASDVRPVVLGEGGESVKLVGIADRVDGYVHGGKLYIRVVDYKTGHKVFSLSDVWYGMGLQMLLYLFVLAEEGSGRYGRELLPAGVMYVPARSAMAAVDSADDSEEIEKQLRRSLRRSGLVLDDPEIIEAWEHGEDKQYIPLRLTRGGRASSDSAASAERLGLLYRHMIKTLGGMAHELRAGEISADPYYRSQRETACLNCDYFDACHFADGEAGESCRYMPKLSADTVWGLLEGGADNS